jgi:hypothetical protein
MLARLGDLLYICYINSQTKKTIHINDACSSYGN